MIPSNPYIAGNPVRGEQKFIGRADVLRDVERTLRKPSTNALVLFGQRRIGKTSVLLHIEEALIAQQEYTPIYFDLQDKASLPLAEVLYQMAQRIAFVTKARLPDKKQFDEQGRFFRETFIPEAVTITNRRGLVLLLDEFDVLDQPQREQAGATFFPYLREWMKEAEGIQFVFVLGRRPEELSTDTLSAFKAISSRRVSLMAQEDTEAIIRQSEKDDSLSWSAEAVNRVWQWTQGHPYFTQLICSEIWETALDEEPDEPSPVTAEAVDAAIDKALEQGANAFQWIWNGLPPAERIVMAAMAEAKGERISREELADILHRSKVRLILRELELAPETLIHWDLLRPADNAFRFAVPLLRRWVSEEKPLQRVKADLDRLEPLAESLYTNGEGFYKIHNLDEAERQLRNALNTNPNHFRARLLLGQVLIGLGRVAEAVEELEPAYEFDPGSTRPGLIGALLAFAEMQNAKEQLQTYERILTIDPSQKTASEQRRAIIKSFAETAEHNNELEAALKYYQEIHDQENIRRIQDIQRKRELEELLIRAETHEKKGNWDNAIAIYAKLLEEFPDEKDWKTRLQHAQSQKALINIYNRAIGALERGDKPLAQTLFGKVISEQPNYKKTGWYLVRIFIGNTKYLRVLNIKRGVLAAVIFFGLIAIPFYAILYNQGYKRGQQDFKRELISKGILESTTTPISASSPPIDTSLTVRSNVYDDVVFIDEEAYSLDSMIIKLPLNGSYPMLLGNEGYAPFEEQQTLKPLSILWTILPTPTFFDRQMTLQNPLTLWVTLSTVVSKERMKNEGNASFEEQQTLKPPSTLWTVLPTSTFFYRQQTLQNPLTLWMTLPTVVSRESNEWTDPKTGMTFVWIEGGCFEMGSPEGEKDRDSDEQRHEVCLEKGFWMGQFEVTNRQYRTWKQEHDSQNYEGHSLNGGDKPVVYVSWDDATAFAKWLTEQHGGRYTFRLPTEAEWEYAARAGTKTAYFWGNDPNDACQYANVTDKTAGNAFGWNWMITCNDSYAVTAHVGSFQPNAFGLYDMAGNVWEWCYDWYSETYYSESPERNPEGPSLPGSGRVGRGGSWSTVARYYRSANRDDRPPADRLGGIGFRLVRLP